MKFMNKIVPLVLATIFFSVNVQAGTTDNKALSTMAMILSHLNHYPSSTEKEALHVMMNDNKMPSEIRVIAAAMMNLQHKPTAADKARLKGLLASDDASENAKMLAKILVNLSHKPSAADKETLKSLQ